MIVDVHTHLPTHVEVVQPGEERTSTRARPDRTVRLTNTFDDYLKAMEPVDRAIVFAIAPRDRGGTVAGFDWPEDFNGSVAALVARAPGELTGFMSVHPEDPGALEELERCAQDLQLRGIKLAANHQNYDPTAGPARTIYERAQRLNLPILFHGGTTGGQFGPLRYGHPLVMDEIAIDYPDLKMVMAHMGHPWFADTACVIRKHPNVYADVSALFYRPWSFYNAMMLAWEWGVMHKLLFGTDWPFTTPQESIDALRRFNEFPHRHRLPELPPDLLEEIINRDSLRLLELES